MRADVTGEVRIVVAARTSRPWGRYAWAAGIVYVIALVAESVIATGVGLTQNDSAAKMARDIRTQRFRFSRKTMMARCAIFTVAIHGWPTTSKSAALMS